MHFPKLTSLAVVRALWPHDALRMSGCVAATVLHHIRLVRGRRNMHRRLQIVLFNN